jgi:hypothetical protein
MNRTYPHEVGLQVNRQERLVYKGSFTLLRNVTRVYPGPTNWTSTEINQTPPENSWRADLVFSELDPMTPPDVCAYYMALSPMRARATNASLDTGGRCGFLLETAGPEIMSPSGFNTRYGG